MTVSSLMCSVPEAACLLGISPRTASRLIDTGAFPVPVRLIGSRRKISRIQLERYAAGETFPAPAPDLAPDTADDTDR